MEIEQRYENGNKTQNSYIEKLKPKSYCLIQVLLKAGHIRNSNPIASLVRKQGNKSRKNLQFDRGKVLVL